MIEANMDAIEAEYKRQQQERAVTDGRDFTEQELVSLIGGLYELRRNADRQKEAYEKAKKPVGEWLLKQSEGYRLTDGETKTFAQYVGGGQEHLLDFDRLLEQGVPGGTALEWLAIHGCLALRWPVYKELPKSSQEQAMIDRFIYTEPRTRRLLIDREKE